ncbi:hypothetical protein BJ912DRAFT_1044563 [Pholiota molesta]|nr:hypothetical protein BJ912DRAFT_1044563 [Pholiota molesta]
MVNIEESRSIQTLTEASMRDSAAIEQISYLTMGFAPAIFVAYEHHRAESRLIRDARPSKNPKEALSDETAEKSALSGALLQERRAVVFKRLKFWERLWWPAILVSTMLERRRLRKARIQRKAMTRVDTMSTNPTFNFRDS